MAYTAAFSTSLGDTAYMPGNEDIDSQDLDLFDADEDSSINESFDTITEGGILTNLQYISRSTLAGEEPWEKHIDDPQEKDVVYNAEAINSNNNVVVRSPAKVTRKATTSLGIPQEALQGQHNLVKGLIRDWIEKQGSEELPLNLVALAERVGIEVTPTDSTSPTHMYQQDKCNKSSPAEEELKETPQEMVLTGQRFILSGTWPRLGGSQGLALGKDNVKAVIERQGGTVTSGFLPLTNALVIGDNPGQKKVINAHERGLPIVKLKQRTSIITNNNKMILDLHSVLYLDTVFTILTQNNIQVKRPPPISDPTEQRRVTGDSTDGYVLGKDDGKGVSHSNG
jgi:hypothetical protein